jgi:ketosteroid isomerase-like protein
MDNIELVRAGFDAFVRRDRGWLPAHVEPDVEWRPALGPLLSQEVYRGPDEVEHEIFDEIPSVLNDFTSEVLEVTEIDDERVLAIVNFKGIAASSGMQIEQVFGQIYTLRDGRVAAMHSYSNKEQALAAASARVAATRSPGRAR